MLPVYKDVTFLDKRCLEEYSLSEDILMEHAALALLQEIVSHETNKTIFILCGPGNNGADGIVLARLLNMHNISCEYHLPFGAKSYMANQQLKRNMALGLNPISEVRARDITVDALFGSGLNRNLEQKSIELIKKINLFNGYKIACDVPSGLMSNGSYDVVFKPDTIVTMGAMKEALLYDHVKPLYRKVVISNLGIHPDLYNQKCNTYLMQESDFNLPTRINVNSHKGSYGHASIIVGNMQGAATISGLSSINFGAGLTTLISNNELILTQYELMQSRALPSTTNAIAIGMGLGNNYPLKDKADFLIQYALIIDADLFYYNNIDLLFQAKRIIITPHPKEFLSLLKICNISNIDIDELQKNRFHYAQIFTHKYPNIVLVLKGANTIVSYKEQQFIVNIGEASLAKGGSGDVLSGMLVALLAQRYTALNAALQAVYAHAKASQHIKVNSYALSPKSLIEAVANL
jgi:ADP-dependent NAD(P)H-hydrate dehydratase / NAD(P)H-hydrate epimerase